MNKKEIEKAITENIYKHISTTKKNIAILSHYFTYRAQYGTLIPKLAQSYNVITIVDQTLDDALEKMSPCCIICPYRTIDESDDSSIIYLDIDIPEIDLIITADQIGYENGNYDKTFLSKKAKRMYLPHRLTYACGESLAECFDYFICPSKSSMEHFKANMKNIKTKFLPCGYPQLDRAIEHYKYLSKNVITYAPTLRYFNTNSTSYLNILAGFDNNMLEWLLEKTKYNIIYRAHPLNSGNEHIHYKLIVSKWENESRIIIDERADSSLINDSDMLITDWSTTSFLYSYTTLRPSLFFMPHPLDASYQQDIEYTVADKTARNFKELEDIIQHIDFEAEKTKLQELRANNIYNLGHSEEAILESIKDIFEGKI